ALSIRPTSVDPTETFNVKVGAIPEGSTLRYGDAEFQIQGGALVLTGHRVGGVWQSADALDPAAKQAIFDSHGLSLDGGDVLMLNFSTSTNLSIRPPENSNTDFTLKVEAQSVD